MSLSTLELEGELQCEAAEGKYVFSIEAGTLCATNWLAPVWVTELNLQDISSFIKVRCGWTCHVSAWVHAPTVLTVYAIGIVSE